MATKKGKRAKSNIKLITTLGLTVVAMFAFGFALVPLYDVFCDITGLNGKTNDTAATYQASRIDKTRTIKVQFISRNARNMPWQFEPIIKEVSVHPGERKIVKFYAKNQSSVDMTGQAVPSISPGIAAAYFQKIECFCFTQQSLKAQQAVEMALQFYVDPELPAEVKTLTLSYTLYDVTKRIDS